MNRNTFIKYLSENLSVDIKKIDNILVKLYNNMNNLEYQEFIDEAIDNLELKEYRACRQFIEYLLHGEL